MRCRINRIWHHMKERCYNINCKDYYNYGGRNIKVCDEWLKSFENFYIWAIISGYKNNLSIDRININGNYEPDNCRWVTSTQQNINRRKFKSNTSGYIGIYYRINLKRWLSTIVINKKQIYLGLYFTQKEALKVRNNYIIEHNLNYPIQEYKGEISSVNKE